MRLVMLLALLLSAGTLSALPFDTNLGGVSSRYTGPLIEALRAWPPPIAYDAVDPRPVRMTALAVADEELYIGAEQAMWVDAPLATVDKIVRGIDQYPTFYRDYIEIRVVSEEKGKLLTQWEKHVPFLFVPNVRLHLWYVIDDSHAGRVVYRYQLKDSNRLRSSDGAVVLEAKGNRTRFTAYDFFDSEYGIVKSLAAGRIWRGALEAIFLTDLAIKLKAEHPDWPSERVREECDKQLEAFPVDKLLDEKKTFHKLPK